MEILEKESKMILENKQYELENKTKDINMQTLIKNLNTRIDYSNFLVLILKVKYNTDFSNLNMYGLKGLDYIKSAVNICETKIVDYDFNEDIIKKIKQNLNEKKYVAVVFSDTPLITRHTFLEILDYFKYKSLCALKFNRGYVFETEYLKSVEKVYNPQVQNFTEEDFIKVTDQKSFTYCNEILKNRILRYHISNGVIIEDLNSCFIDAEVNIESGVTICPNVCLKGKTTIKENSYVGFNSFIKDSLINKNCKIENSILENSVIELNCKVLDYSVIKNAKLNENSIVSNENIIGG